MKNIEITAKLEEISTIPDFCDMVETLAIFNKDYKKTVFFKKTKMPLTKLFEAYKLNKTLTLKGIFANLQARIKELDLSNITAVFDQISEQTQADIASGASALKDINIEELLKNLGVK